MDEDIKFDPTVTYLGRNGMGKCIGISVDKHTAPFPYYTLYPINSKESIARCYIEIPAAQAGQVAAAMNADLLGLVLDQIPDRLPCLLGLNPELDKMIAQRLKGK